MNKKYYKKRNKRINKNKWICNKRNLKNKVKNKNKKLNKECKHKIKNLKMFNKIIKWYF